MGRPGEVYWHGPRAFIAHDRSKRSCVTSLSRPDDPKVGHETGNGPEREGVQCATTFLGRSRILFRGLSRFAALLSLPPSLPLSFLLFPFLSSAANIACGVLMSLGMHEVREPRGRPRPSLSDADVDCTAHRVVTGG